MRRVQAAQPREATLPRPTRLTWQRGPTDDVSHLPGRDTVPCGIVKIRADSERFPGRFASTYLFPYVSTDLVV